MKREILKETIEILKKETSKYGYPYICLIIDSWQMHTKFGTQECKEVLEWFREQQPTKIKYSEFYKHSSYIDGYSWWCNTEIEQRILFINKLLKDL